MAAMNRTALNLGRLSIGSAMSDYFPSSIQCLGNLMRWVDYASSEINKALRCGLEQRLARLGIVKEALRSGSAYGIQQYFQGSYLRLTLPPRLIPFSDTMAV